MKKLEGFRRFMKFNMINDQDVIKVKINKRKKETKTIFIIFIINKLIISIISMILII
jgi:hypothetical protein